MCLPRIYEKRGEMAGKHLQCGLCMSMPHEVFTTCSTHWHPIPFAKFHGFMGQTLEKIREKPSKIHRTSPQSEPLKQAVSKVTFAAWASAKSPMECCQRPIVAQAFIAEPRGTMGILDGKPWENPRETTRCSHGLKIGGATTGIWARMDGWMVEPAAN